MKVRDLKKEIILGIVKTSQNEFVLIGRGSLMCIVVKKCKKKPISIL